MVNSNFFARLIFGLMLAACGGGCEPGTGEGAQSTPTGTAGGEKADTRSERFEPASRRCAEGGTACPAGLECVTWRGGNRACGPMAAPGVVLIRDATLGGRCISSTQVDSHPGASIASLQIIGVDGNAKGRGRMLWDKAGFEVAAERGSPPDGAEFTGDACAEAYNIGCDGEAVFEIVDDGGEVQKLREGETVIVHLRGQDACGEEVAEQVTAAICNEPAAAAAGNLESCTFKVRMVEVQSDLYGPARHGGTIEFFQAH